MKTRTVYKIRLKKGDTVMVRSGKFKGKTGKVLATHPTLNAVTIEGLNILKRSLKRSTARPQGGMIDVHKPLAVSKVGLLEPTSKKVSKISYKVNAKGNKTRVYKSTGKEIK